jgi:hypothetical protein
MEVPRVPPIPPADSGLPAGGERPAGGGGDLPFGPGQKLFAQVIQALGDGRAVLDVGGERLMASTPLPVRNGDVLAVVVRSIGAVIELDIEAPPVAFSERAYALAAVRQAIQQIHQAAVRPLTSPSSTCSPTRSNARTGAGSGGASPRDRLLAMLRPLPCSRRRAAGRRAARSPGVERSVLRGPRRSRADPGRHATVTLDLQGDLRWAARRAERKRSPSPKSSRDNA